MQSYHIKLLSGTAMSNLFTMGLVGELDPRRDIPCSPQELNKATALLRAQLLFEECKETLDGLGFHLEILLGEIHIMEHGKGFNMEKTIDGCCDVNYVSVGTLCAMGVPDEPHMQIVCNANDAKFPDCTVITDPRGKFQKPPGWRPPCHDTDSLIKINLKSISEDIIRNARANQAR